MAVGLLLLVVVGGLVVVAVRRAGAHAGAAEGEGYTVRRFFQYLLLYGLLVVVAVGLSGLLGRLLTRDVLVAGAQVALARNLAFTVVGGPLLVGLALWTRQRLDADPREARALGWAVYVTAASLTALLVVTAALTDVLGAAVGIGRYDGQALARALVWGALWGAHWWVDARVTPREHTRAHHLLGSLVGLVLVTAGLGALLAGALSVLLGLEVATIVGGAGRPMLEGLVTFLVGVPVWFGYWVRTASRDDRGRYWLGYVLLVGVAGGLVTAMVSASLLLDSVLVWLLGDPGAAGAREHFTSAPAAAAGAVVGLLVWWYHAEVLRGAGVTTRTEVRRVYEYLMAGIGLVAAAVGLTMVLAGLVEALTGSAFVGGGATNTLLAAVTLLVVGGPVWWLYWRRIRTAAGADPAAELTSPTRRVYLFLMLGTGGLAAVVALIVAVYLLFEGVVAGTFGEETIRRMRFAVGVLVTAVAVAAYHALVYRDDRERAPAAAEAHGPRYVLLVGPADSEIARAVAHRTHGRVQAWVRTDDGAGAWSVEDVMAAVTAAAAQEVLVIAEPAGLRTIPLRRGGPVRP